MATTNSPIMQGMTGVIGGLLFRNVQGRTVVSARPSELSRSRKQRQSTLQRLNRDRFREASYHARAMMLDPRMKAYYWEKAKKLNLPNGYTAAIADYMRKTSVQQVSTKRYTGKAGGSIAIKTQKKDFAVAEVNVKLTTKEGQEIEKGAATRTSSGEWVYKNTVPVATPQNVTVVVEVKDRMGNKTVATLTGKEPLRCDYWRATHPIGACAA